MSPSTLSAGVSATRPNILVDESESHDARPACSSLALSVEAKERLKLLNRVLANCVPPSLEMRSTQSGETQWD